MRDLTDPVFLTLVGACWVTIATGEVVEGSAVLFLLLAALGLGAFRPAPSLRGNHMRLSVCRHDDGPAVR